MGDWLNVQDPNSVIQGFVSPYPKADMEVHLRTGQHNMKKIINGDFEAKSLGDTNLENESSDQVFLTDKEIDGLFPSSDPDEDVYSHACIMAILCTSFIMDIGVIIGFMVQDV